MAMMQENTRAMLENSRLLAKEEREALIESQRDSSPGGRNGSYRGGSGIAGLEFKQNLQVLKDTETDFERHYRHFQSIVDCHSVSRGVITPLEVLTLYRKCLPVGSTRERAYTTLVTRAQRNGRLPKEASAVLAEMREKLRTMIFETTFQRQDRLEKEFDALQMNKSSHTEFRSLWEEKVDECLEAGVFHASEPSLDGKMQRKYLSKLSADLRSTVLGKVWALDGEDRPARKPKTRE